MSNEHGNFIWYELLTSDADAAAAFYSKVVGWTAEDSGQPDVRYTLFKANGTDAAGLMSLTPAMRDQGAQPAWLGYIAVRDLDGTVEAMKAAGGTLRQAPPDIPGVGRFAVLADPQGAAFGLFAPLAAQDAVPPMSTGRVGWHELHSTDWEAGFSFYAGQFGWSKTEALDMGPMGTYQLFSYGKPDPVGGMMNDRNFPRPAWLFYFVVEDIDAGAERIAAAGGQVLNGPMEVPGGAFVVDAVDPQGAMFALVGMRG